MRRKRTIRDSLIIPLLNKNTDQEDTIADGSPRDDTGQVMSAETQQNIQKRGYAAPSYKARANDMGVELPDADSLSGGANVNSSMNGGNNDVSSATTMPVPSLEIYGLTLPQLPAYIGDRKFRGLESLDDSTSAPIVQSEMNSTSRIQPEQDPNDPIYGSTPGSDTTMHDPAVLTQYGERNLDPNQIAQARDYGIRPGEKKYHTTRRRQAIEGLLRGLAQLANPGVADSMSNYPLAALALAGAGAGSGAVNKNVLGKERLNQDINQSRAQEQYQYGKLDKLSQIRAREAQTEYNLKRPDIAAAKDKAQTERQSARLVATNEQKEKDRLMKSGAVQSWRHIIGTDNNVYRDIVYKNGEHKTELVTTKDAEGNDVPMTSGAAVQAGLRIEISRENAQTARMSAEKTSSGNVSTSTAQTSYKRDLNTISHEVDPSADSFDDLSDSDKQAARALYESPSNRSTTRTTVRKPAGGTPSPKQTGNNYATLLAALKAGQAAGHKGIKIKLKKGGTAIVYSQADLDQLRDTNQVER